MNRTINMSKTSKMNHMLNMSKTRKTTKIFRKEAFL